MIVKAVLVTSSLRQFPYDELPDKPIGLIDVALGERFSFQMAYRSDESTGYDVYRVDSTIEGPKGWKPRVRRVGNVPVAHQNIPFERNTLDNDGLGKIPGFVPDALFDDTMDVLRPFEKQAYWYSAMVPRDAKPGKYELVVYLQLLARDGKEKIGKPLVRRVSVRVHNVALEPRSDFAVTNWFYSDCLIAWYKTKGFDERFWELAANYFRDMVDHGQDTLYVPAFTPSLDRDKIPSQLVKVKSAGKGKYKFDWSDVKRYVDLARKCGFTRFEWCHLASQAGAKNAIRIYEGQGEGEKLLWPDGTPSTSDVYRRFLEAYLPELKKFLDDNKLASRSYFHISDEPHGEEARENYRAVREMIVSIAPWFKPFDALSDIEFVREGLVDMPVSFIMKALDFISEGVPAWCYYCGGPRGKYINRLADTALPKIAMHGFVLYRWPFKGFLHWGYNYWNVFGTRNLSDPFTSLNGRDGGGRSPDAGHGDMFMVYPGENGPIDSIRWEIFAEALQDYQLLETVHVDRACRMMTEIKSFEDFPKDPEWRAKMRASLLRKY